MSSISKEPILTLTTKFNLSGTGWLPVNEQDVKAIDRIFQTSSKGLRAVWFSNGYSYQNTNYSYKPYCFILGATSYEISFFIHEYYYGKKIVITFQAQQHKYNCKVIV